MLEKKSQTAHPKHCWPDDLPGKERFTRKARFPDTLTIRDDLPGKERFIMRTCTTYYLLLLPLLLLPLLLLLLLLLLLVLLVLLVLLLLLVLVPVLVPVLVLVVSS